MYNIYGLLQISTQEKCYVLQYMVQKLQGTPVHVYSSVSPTVFRGLIPRKVCTKLHP